MARFSIFFWCRVFNFVSPRAIEVGEKFPDAQVIGVDRNPVLPRFVPRMYSRSRILMTPCRPTPSNVRFQQLDILADPLPWEGGSFDVVHLRFLLFHVRRRQIRSFSLQRVPALVLRKPPPTHSSRILRPTSNALPCSSGLAAGSS
jgi:SAM-dependent methyltransferase